MVYGVTTRDPLGPIPTNPDQLARFDTLIGKLHSARTEPDLEQEPELLGIEI